MKPDWKDELRQTCPGRFAADEPMSRHTTFRVGGPAELMFLPKDVDALRGAVIFARERGVRVTIIGLGSNLLVRDSGIPGLTVKLGGMRGTPELRPDGRIRAAAGFPLIKLVLATIRAGLGGIENLSGIPGSIGGAVWMNAGAYGDNIARHITSVTALQSADIITFKRDAIRFEYRRSEFMDRPRDILLETELQLTPDDPRRLAARRREYLAARKSKHPDLPSAGSFFRNPPALPSAGKLIDEAGCKGLQIGGALVSKKHANFLCNTGGATCDDLLRLADKVRQAVLRRHNVLLEPEVRIIP